MVFFLLSLLIQESLSLLMFNRNILDNIYPFWMPSICLHFSALLQILEYVVDSFLQVIWLIPCHRTQHLISSICLILIKQATEPFHRKSNIIY